MSIASTAPFYEQRLRADFTYALVRDLNGLRVPYAIAGDLAMFAHGFRRSTEAVQVLVTCPIPQSLDELSAAKPTAAAQLAAMKADGIVLDGLFDRGRLRLISSNRQVAKKYQMHPEDEYFAPAHTTN